MNQNLATGNPFTEIQDVTPMVHLMASHQSSLVNQIYNNLEFKQPGELKKLIVQITHREGSEVWFRSQSKLSAINTQSPLYGWLLSWYSTTEKLSSYQDVHQAEENLLSHVRSATLLNNTLYFVQSGTQTSLDKDLLGGLGDGRTLKRFKKFLDGAYLEQTKDYRQKLNII